MSLNARKDELAKISVLVVDDDDAMARMVEALLREIGITKFYKAKNGADGLDHFASGVDVIDLVICDWLMPEMDGLEFLRRMRAMHSEIPFLMLTRRRAPDDVVQAKDAGVTAYIPKPFNAAQFRGKIEKLLVQVLASKEGQ